MKPGWATTEFWGTIATCSVAMLLASGIIAPADRDAANATLTNAITAIGALVASAWTVIHYVRSRTALKEGLQSAAARTSLLARALNPASPASSD
jgi:hypothetical protein